MSAFALARPGWANTTAHAPAGGGLGPLDVGVDLASAVVHANQTLVPIGLSRADLPDERGVSVEVVGIGEGRSVVHVRVDVRGHGEGTRAWEAILAADRREPIFAGQTGYLEGDLGERTGQAVQIVEGPDTTFVLVGTIREDLRICGQETTLLEPRAVYPNSLELRPVSLQRLSVAQQKSARTLLAVDQGDRLATPLAPLLAARGTSVPGSQGTELTDGRRDTVWRELRPGVGRGEFVTMNVPGEVRITGFQFATAPESAGVNATPKTFYLTTAQQSFEVTVPEASARQPARVFEVTLPEPIATSCLSLVLGDAYAPSARPDVGLAEAVAFSEFDRPNATLDDAAKSLSGPRGASAQRLLESALNGGLEAASRAYGGLDESGRVRAVQMAASRDSCAEATPLLIRGLCDESERVAHIAREHVNRCPSAIPALVRRMRETPEAGACVAPSLARLAPQEAIAPIADAMGKASRTEAAATLRSAFAEALGLAGPSPLPGLLSDPARSPASRLEILRAAGSSLTAFRKEADGAFSDLLQGTPPFRVRYLVLQPLATMAQSGDGDALRHLSEAVSRDPDWPVRAHAAEVSAKLEAVRPSLLGALHDPEPRVREAALGALSMQPSPDAAGEVIHLLASDSWPFVRADAADLLARTPSSASVDDALGHAVSDGAASVRRASIGALAGHRARAWRGAIRERLDDANEAMQVRDVAAAALGALCDSDSIARLTELALPLSRIETEESERELGLSALAALGELHPSDLATRLAPLLAPSAPPATLALAKRALHAKAIKGVCP